MGDPKIFLTKVRIIKNISGNPDADYTVGLTGVATMWLLCLDGSRVYWVSADDGITYICDEAELENI